jgi:menaquinone-dependent protoporphyrinogen oxidase
MIRVQKFEVDGINTEDDIPTDFSISSYYTVIIDSSLHNHKYNSSIIEYIYKYKSHLQRYPSAFFSISLGDIIFIYKGVDKLMDSLFTETDWYPKTVGRFGGALKYTRYDIWTKLCMGIAGLFMSYPTDTTRDHELIDWE